MINLFSKIYTIFRKDTGFILLYIVLLLFSVIILMPIFEKDNSSFSNILDSVWWFFVTITTVGYGDISPGSSAGKVLAIFVMLSGIGLAASGITFISTKVIDNRKKLIQGKKQLKSNNHIVILGFNSRIFYNLVEEIKSDKLHSSMDIVLCANEIEENPMPDKISFVKGIVHSDLVMTKANIAKAKHIIIPGKDDHENILATLAVYSINKSAHIVVYLEDYENIKHIQRISPDISTVNPVSVPLIVQEMQDRGTLKLINDLLSNRIGSQIYRIHLPKQLNGISFKNLFVFFKEKYQSTIIGIEKDDLILNPAMDLQIEGGEIIFFIAEERFENIEWNQISMD